MPSDGATNEAFDVRQEQHFGGKEHKMARNRTNPVKKLSALLVAILAALALTVLLGQLDGQTMWGWIIAYWLVLAAMNLADYTGILLDLQSEEVKRK